MPRYKRTFDDAELDIPLEPEMPPDTIETLRELRSMWEFASFMQYVFLFGHVVKIDDDLDIEDLEAECLKPQPSEKLALMGLAMLKYVSSHRGLTLEIFDEYTRRQYVAKAPQRNPYGEEEEPAKFNDFDMFTKIRVLQQLSTWTLGNAERIRGMMPQDEDHLNWRMEPLGWDKDDRAYFVLDDNRLYRRTDELPPPPTPKPKVKSKASSKKSKSKATRASKRRRIEETSDEELEEVDADIGAQEDTVMTNGDHAEPAEESGYGFTAKTWECIAITLEEYNDFLASIFRTRDPNEKQLRKRIEEDVLPIIEKRAESLKQKQMKKIRELENLQKMATAKRSSRLAYKAEKDAQDREERDVEEKKQRDLKMAHEEQEKLRRIEDGHESRRLTREQRLKEREVKRILHEEELTKIEEEASRAESQGPSSDPVMDGDKRVSQRQLKTQKENHKKELAKLTEDEGRWIFDCSVCGLHGENLDDGSHSVACERCNVWQHSKCHGLPPKRVEQDGFHFICPPCKRKEADAKKPKIPPLKLSAKKSSESPESQRNESRPATANGQKGSGLPDHVARQLDGVQHYQPPRVSPGPFGQITNGPNFSPYGQQQGSPGYRYPPVANFAPHPTPPQQPWHGSPFPPPANRMQSMFASSPPPQPVANGYGSPPHHQQQHQSAHQNAVVASGGHPAYQQTYQPQPNGYSPRAPAGAYPMTQPPPQHQQYYPPQRGYQYQQQPLPPSPQHRTGSGQLMNGFQSPVKDQATPSTSPPQHQLQPSYGQGYAPPPQQQSHQQLGYSPNPSFPPPPPPNTYQQYGAQSPVKSSPPPPHYQQAQPQRPVAQTPRSLTSTPQQVLRPSSSNGVNASTQTPQMLPVKRTPQQQTAPSPASANANGIVADGMSGPWPEGSKAIPQKHDQSPAPPPPSGGQRVGETKVLPPVAPLVPSPSQQMMQAAATGPGSVPIKRDPKVQVGSSTGVGDGIISEISEASSAAIQPLTAAMPSGEIPDANGTLKESVLPAQTADK